jgi:small-conductance mechanosensitive channel
MTEVDQLILAARGEIWTKSAPSMLSADYYSQFGDELWEELRKSLSTPLWSGRKFIEKYGWLLFSQVFLSLSLTIGIFRHRSLLEREEQWLFIARRPCAAGIFVGFFIPLLLFRPPSRTGVWALNVLMIIALARLAGGFVAKSSTRWIVYVLAILLIATGLLQVFGLPPPLFRLYLLFTSATGMFLCIWGAEKSVHGKNPMLYIWALRLGGLVFLALILALVSGYSALATYVFLSSLNTAFVALAVWMLRIMAHGLLDYTMQSSPLKRIPFLRSKANLIVSKSKLLVDLLIGALFTTIMLVVLRVYEDPIEGIQAVLSFGFTVGSRRITMALILIAVAFLYGSFLISWAVQAILMEGVFVRRQLQVGIRISMARLIHYAFVSVGFLLALVALGVNLRDITIIAGALGVGIGFGLQGIVNNFVSGLILLFERPIKVGDYIQIGEHWAEVKKIGLRATVVETFDQSEVVVPNSDLVSSQVTNWTLTHRLGRIIIPVGVAYGSDVPLVMQTLMECAEANPLVAKRPAPQVLFLAFGNSSLDIQLRVWVSEIDNRLQVQSELHQEIDRRFRELDVEIAFPQRDLHLRSIDETVASPPVIAGGETIRLVPDKKGGEEGLVANRQREHGEQDP